MSTKSIDTNTITKINDAAKKEIIDEFAKLEYNKEDIVNGINNVNCRLSWSINSLCLVYSRGNKKWFRGKIVNIYINETTNEEWLNVLYKNKCKKQIQRF
eukprot:36682_1